MSPNDKDEKKKKKNKEYLDSAAGDVNTPLQDNNILQDSSAISDYSVLGVPRKKRRKGWIILLVIVVVLAVIVVLPRFLGLRKIAFNAGTFTAYTVKRGDITVTLSGSGTLQPADSYTVTSLISGDILKAPFEEGDIVNKDQVLYNIDSSDVDSSIKQAENTVNDSQTKYNSALKLLDNLQVKAGGAGAITELNVQQGDNVQAGQVIASIRDSDIMSIKILFLKAATEHFYIGESASVTLDSTAETYTGNVSAVSTIDQVLTGNVLAREVTIDVKNPGVFSPDQTAFANIGGVFGLQNGTFDYKYTGDVSAAVAGKVSQINIAVGSHVVKDQIIAVLQSDSVDQQIQSAKITLDNAKLALDSQTNKESGYSIKSPISGTIVEKDYKAGDTMKAGEDLCTIFDLSHLILTLNVDELDIKKVQPGQSVTITADAVKGSVYTGIVTKVNIKGTTKTGVTSYPVTIQIDQSNDLLPGMNVDAKIVVESLKNVITVPVSAVLRNNFVLLKSNEVNPKVTQSGVPAGYNYTEVTLGSANDKEIVITKGLKEGDIVAVMDQTPTSYEYNPLQRGQNREPASSSESSDSRQSSQTAAGVSG